jgi:hypothetical protein
MSKSYYTYDIKIATSKDDVFYRFTLSPGHKLTADEVWKRAEEVRKKGGNKQVVQITECITTLVDVLKPKP